MSVQSPKLVCLFWRSCEEGSRRRKENITEKDKQKLACLRLSLAKNKKIAVYVCCCDSKVANLSKYKYHPKEKKKHLFLFLITK